MFVYIICVNDAKSNKYQSYYIDFRWSSYSYILKKNLKQLKICIHN